MKYISISLVFGLIIVVYAGERAASIGVSKQGVYVSPVQFRIVQAGRFSIHAGLGDGIVTFGGKEVERTHVERHSNRVLRIYRDGRWV